MYSQDRNSRPTSIIPFAKTHDDARLLVADELARATTIVSTVVLRRPEMGV